MKKNFIIILAVTLVVIITAAFFMGKEPKKTQDSGDQSMSQQQMDSNDLFFVEKLGEAHPDWPIQDFSANVEKSVGNYAYGTFSSTGGLEGSFYAMSEDGEWSIVWSGNGVLFCEDIEQYNFPVEIVSRCFDKGTNNVKAFDEVEEEIIY